MRKRSKIFLVCVLLVSKNLLTSLASKDDPFYAIRFIECKDPCAKKKKKKKKQTKTNKKRKNKKKDTVLHIDF